MPHKGHPALYNKFRVVKTGLHKYLSVVPGVLTLTDAYQPRRCCPGLSLCHGGHGSVCGHVTGPMVTHLIDVVCVQDDGAQCGKHVICLLGHLQSAETRVGQSQLAQSEHRGSPDVVMAEPIWSIGGFRHIRPGIVRKDQLAVTNHYRLNMNGVRTANVKLKAEKNTTAWALEGCHELTPNNNNIPVQKNLRTYSENTLATHYSE